MSEEELRYIYANPTGTRIFTPIYNEYKKYFFNQVLEHTPLKTVFTEYRETGVYERYMLNLAQFSAAKNAAEAAIMQTELFAPGGKLKSFQRFKKDIADLDIVHIENEVHMRVEYETCRRNVISGTQWARMEENADLYPYWIWEGVLDRRERPEHVAMEGKVFRIGDPYGDKMFPPSGWNCRCRGVPIDDMYLQEKHFRPSTPAEAKKLMEENVPANFRYNAAKQGPLPNDHSYFQVLPNANAANANMFGLGSLEDGKKHLLTLAGKGLAYVVELVHGWRRDHHVDNRHNIVFQNKATYTNVRLTETAIHDISKYPGGMDQLPAAIQHPTEIWSQWDDVQDQRVVLRTYIKMGSTPYVVTTRDGKVDNAFAISKQQVDNFRKGVILY